MLLLVGCVPLMIVSFYYYNLMHDKTMKEYNDTNLQMLSAIQTDVDYYIASHLAALRLLAQNPHVINLEPEGRSYLVINRKLYPNFELVADDTHGDQIYNDDNRLKANIAHRQYFKDAVSGKEAFSEVIISLATRQPLIVMAVPMRNQETITGVMQGAITLSTLHDFLKERVNNQYAAFMVDQTGKVLAHTDPKLATERKDLSKEAYIQDGLKGNNGFTTIKNEQGQELYIYYVYDSSMGWLICTEIPSDVVLAPVRALQKSFIGVITLLILIISVFGYMVSNKLVNPIKIVCERAREVAKGNLSVEEIKVLSNDEIGELAKSFNYMIVHLKELVKNISHSAEQLAASSEELTAGAEQSAQAANQVAGSITDVASGTVIQLRVVDDTTNIVEQMSINFQKIATNVDGVAATADETSTASTEGERAINKVKNQMSSIENSVGSSARVIAKLGERSKEIGQIVNTISGIAGQTNLLALNAAIEAARAGEQGRGFAVVADEVRKLAEQSQNAAKQITVLIGEIQGDTDKAIVSISEGNREVKLGTEVVTTAGQAFEKISGLISKVSDQVQNISGTIQQMASGSQQIVSSVKEIDRISNNTVSQMQTVSAATEEQSASMEEIASSSQYLAKIAEELRATVSKFRV